MVLKKYTSLLPAILMILFSCDHIPTENDAVEINQRGIVYMNAGKYDSALSYFLKAIQNPKLSKISKGTIYRNIAITYSELVNVDSAVHYSTLASKCYRKNSFNYLVNLADVDLHVRKTGDALNKLIKAVNIEPGEMSVNNSLGLIYLGEYDDVFTDLKKALEYNSKAFELDNSRVIEEVLARNYYKLDDFENAQLHYTHLLGEHPDLVTYPLYMGMIKHKMRKMVEAENFFEKVILMDSSYKETIAIFKQNN
jgi:tetratricopeptide (TPR) repeat protein